MLIRAEKIKKEFIRKGTGTNVFTAVNTTDFELKGGEITVIQGRSGSGKSTLLNILSGILTPTEGKVYYDDKDIYAMDDGALSEFRNRHIGYIPQGSSAIISLTVKENILLPLIFTGEDAKAEADDEFLKSLMKELSIIHLSDEKSGGLSGGELRRMSIARALIRKPQVIFADEPTGDLDDENTDIVFKLLRKCAEDGAAVLLVTHENTASDYADRIYRMDAGVLKV